MGEGGLGFSPACASLWKMFPKTPGAEAKAPVTLSHTREPVQADLRLFMQCKADSDCCSHLPPTYSSSWDRAGQAARLLMLEEIPKGLW